MTASFLGETDVVRPHFAACTPNTPSNSVQVEDGVGNSSSTSSLGIVSTTCDTYTWLRPDRGRPVHIGLNIAKVPYAATSVDKWFKQAIFPGFGGQTLPKMVSGAI